MGRCAAGEGGGVEGRALQKMKNPDVERCREKAVKILDQDISAGARYCLHKLYLDLMCTYDLCQLSKWQCSQVIESNLNIARRTEADADVMAKALGVEL